MAWGDSHESEVRKRENRSNIPHHHDLVSDRRCLCVCVLQVLVGSVNGTVKTFSTEKGIFTATRECGDPSQGRFTGLSVTDRLLPISCYDCLCSG